MLRKEQGLVHSEDSFGKFSFSGVEFIDVFDVELFVAFDVQLFDVFDDQSGRRPEVLLLHGAGVEEAQNRLILVRQNVEIIRKVRPVSKGILACKN